MLSHGGMHGHAWFGTRVGEDIHFMAEVEQAGDLPENKSLRNDRELADEEGDAQGIVHRAGCNEIVWNTSA